MVRTIRVTSAILAVSILGGLMGCLPVIGAAVFGVIDATETTTPNTTPAVLLEPVARTDAPTVDVPIRVFDADGDMVTLDVEIWDGGWSDATFSPTQAQGSPAGNSVVVEWNAQADLGTTGYAGSLRVRITPRDGSATGITVESPEFAYGNDAPVITALTVDSLGDDDGVSENVILRLSIEDSANDPVDIESFLVSEIGDFSDAINVELTDGSSGNLPGGAITQIPTPSTNSITWNSPLTAPFRSPDTRIRMTVVDQFGAVSAVFESAPFTLVNQTPPAVRITRIGASASDGTRYGLVDIYFDLEDEEGDLADVRVEYSTDSGSSWRACTEYPWPFSAGRYDLPTGEEVTNHRYTWDAAADVVGQPQDVLIRITPADNPSNIIGDTGHIGQPALASSAISVGDRQNVTGDLGTASAGNFRLAAGDLYANTTTQGLWVLTVPQVVTRVFRPATSLPMIEVGGSQMPTFNGRDIAVYDFDGDRDDDVFTVGADDLLIWRNDNGLSFPSWRTFTPEASVVANGLFDYNDDGEMDLVTIETSGSSGVLRIVAGPTAPTPGQLLARRVIGSSPGDLHIADVTNDGIPDILVASETGSFVDMYAGTTTGTIPSSPTRVHTGAVEFVRSGDINGDGLADLVIAGNGVLYGRLGTGSGTFATTATTLITSESLLIPAIHVVDVNRDGIDDVAFADDQRLRVIVFDINGNAFSWLDQPIGPQINDIIVFDHNGDGRREIAVGSGSANPSGQVTFFVIDDFRPLGTSSIGTGTDVVSADFDRDGFPDVSTVKEGTNRGHRMYWGRGENRFDETLALNADFARHRAADINGDGWLDVVLGTGSDTLRLRLNNGDRTWSDAPTASITTGSITDHWLADMDDDGDIDILMARNGEGLYLARNTGTGSFGTATRILAASAVYSVAIFDFNSDGLLDLAVGIPNNAHIMRNQGGGSFTITDTSTSFPYPTDMRVTASRDSDGSPDLVFRSASTNGGAGRLWLPTINDQGLFTSGGTNFALNTNFLFGLADLSADGQDDMLMIAESQGNSAITLAPAVDGFSYNGLIDTAIVADRVIVGDVFGTGRPDLIYTTTGGEVRRASGRSSVEPSSIVAEEYVNGVGNVVGSNLIDSQRDRFGDPREYSIGLRRYIATGVDGPTNLSGGAPMESHVFMLRANAAIGDQVGSMTPLTDPWRITGSMRFVTTTDPGTGTNTGTRIQAVNRFGTRTVTDPTAPTYNSDLQRTGLSLPGTETSFSNQRGIVLILPVRADVTQTDYISARTNDNITVLWKRRDFTRANEISSDPFASDARANEFLPRLLNGGTNWRDLIGEEADGWQVVPADADGDFTTGSVAASTTNPFRPADAGPRFIAQGNFFFNRRIVVFLPADGIVQAVIRR